MFDAPFEDWYVWLGVAAVSIAILGVVLALPAAAPPDAAGVADAVDRVAASPPGADATHDLAAEAMKLDRRRVTLRGRGGTAHATLAYGPVAPAAGNERLAAVLGGRRPAAVFEGGDAFAAAVESARNATGEWRPAPDTLRIRHVSWEGVDVVLVG